jgi:hypothetical protein
MSGDAARKECVRHDNIKICIASCFTTAPSWTRTRKA